MPVSIPKQLSRTRRLILETHSKYNQDNCAMLAAALAFHSFFSIFPLVLFLIYVGSEVLQTAGVRELLSSGLIRFLPAGGDTISEIISATLDLRGSIGLVGVVGLVWSASSVFAVLETALNRIWKAKPRGYWRKRLVATGSILVLSLVFLASVTFGQFLPRLLSLIQRPGLQWLGSLASFLGLVLVLTIFYSAFPSRKIPRRAALSGGLAAGLALLGARALFDMFINSAFANYGSVYGSLAWIVSLALWTYVVATLFLLGAELGSVLEAEEAPLRRAGA
ncbi:MAG TPA: YihY/virulence factor BrkB family protein [Anaerolineales bacterium]|nr:YihY/virulence factor BrkB family protein [Anaerolineales bacterium]